jgi:hypothetical protein
MKKVFLILPIMAGAIFLGGCGNSSQQQPTAGENPTGTNKAVEADKGNGVGAVAGSLKEMVGMGKQMVCVMNENGVETKTYIEGKKYKSTTDSKEMTMNSIFDGEAFYSWNTKTKAGTKMTMACMEEIGKNMPKAAGDGSDFASTDKLIEDEAKNNNCQEAKEKVDFTLPADIDFVDQCLMMQNITKNMPKGELPANFKMPTE